MINPVYSPDNERYSNGMKYRRCGKSGIMLPEISLGLWHNFGDVDTFANSQRMAIMLSIRESLISIWQITTGLPMARQKKRSVRL